MGDPNAIGQEKRGTLYEKSVNPKLQPGAEVRMTQDHVGVTHGPSANAEAKRGRPQPDADVPKGYVAGADKGGAPGNVQFVNEMGSGTMRKIADPNGSRDADDRLR